MPTSINTTWDLAFTYGHLSMRFLQSAETCVLNFHNLVQQERLQEKNVWVEAEGWTNIDLDIISKKDQLKDSYFEFISASIVFFQISMEAIINDSIHISDQLSSFRNQDFAPKWLNSLQKLGETDHNVNIYLEQIYRPCRNTIIHPTQKKIDQDKFNNLGINAFQSVKIGLRAGWRAYEQLYRKLGMPHVIEDGHSESWETLCAINGVQPECNPPD